VIYATTKERDRMRIELNCAVCGSNRFSLDPYEAEGLRMAAVRVIWLT